MTRCAATWTSCCTPLVPGYHRSPLFLRRARARGGVGAGRDRAYHAVTEAGGTDAECSVEATAHVLQCDVVGEFDDLAVVEMLPKPVEQLVGDINWGAGHAHGVVEDQLV